MAHWSEDSQPLLMQWSNVGSMNQLPMQKGPNGVYLLLLPGTSASPAGENAEAQFRQIASWAAQLPEQSVVCVLSAPVYASSLLPLLQESLKYQLWVGVKSEPIATSDDFALPQTHLSLLIMTRYKGSLRHTKTRIAYTYCPACGKTTKDYGGKKHTYHEYGTLMADVWRDVCVCGDEGIEPVIHRLKDVFGVAPYEILEVMDLRGSFPVSEAKAPVRESVRSSVETAALSSALLNEDCLAALSKLPDNSIDFCFADPPYNVQKQYDKWDDALESKAYFDWCDQWLSEMARVLKPGGTLAVLNIPLWTARHFQHLQTILQFQNWIAWEALGFPVRQIMPAHYAILCFSKGAARELPGLNLADVRPEDRVYLAPLTENYCVRGTCLSERRRRGVNDRSPITDIWADVHRLKHNSRRVDHPCQLPPLLMQRLYALFTYPDEIILDCFNGAGTSTLVARQMGRRYIGIELSPQYHALAVERHQQIEQGENPFAKRAPDHVPTAKNSRVGRLPKRQYSVPKKLLQLEVKRIAQEMGRLPSREEVASRTTYPMEYYDGYFSSWGEACAAARTTGMSELPPNRREAQMRLALERKRAYQGNLFPLDAVSPAEI